MVCNKSNNNLTPYWQRIVDEAEKQLSDKISRLEKITVSPEFCLLDSDKVTMAKRQFELEALHELFNDVKKGGFRGKFISFEEVLFSKPSYIFTRPAK
jgi:hypothetical protein